MSNTFTKTYLDGDPLLEDDLDNGFETVQPSLANLALATTGSSSGDVLKSSGSNLAPAWISPDSLAASMTSTGANAIFADINATSSVLVCNNIVDSISSCSALAANIIVDAISSCSAAAANIVLDAISSCSQNSANIIGNVMGASGANALIAQVTICASAAANVIADAATRATGTTVSHLGVALSANSGNFTSTASSFTDVTNLSVTITTSGRPVLLALDSASTDPTIQSSLAATENNNAGSRGELQFLRGTSTVGVFLIGGTYASALGGTGLLYQAPGALSQIDAVVAGTYTYKVQVKYASPGASDSIAVTQVRLTAREL